MWKFRNPRRISYRAFIGRNLNEPSSNSEHCLELLFSLVVPFCLTGLIFYILFFRNRTLEEWKYKLGLYGPAVMSISVLDSLEKPQNFSALGEHEISVTWKIEGFTSYLESFDDEDGALGRFENLPSGKRLDRSGSGFWMLYHTPKDVLEETLSRSSIFASNIIEHVTNSYSASMEELEVAVAVRVFVDGEATVKIKYSDSATNEVKTERLSITTFASRGFCYKILNVPFNKRIRTVEIEPIIINRRRHGIVVVDEVIVVVSRIHTSESIINTMVPKSWCS